MRPASATRLSRVLVCCYPRRWRERYRQEMLDVLDQHPAAEKVDPQPADAKRALDVLRPLGFRAMPDGRPEIDGHRGHDRRGKQRDDERQAEPDVAERLELAQTLEQLH